jgi:hypothetical protein
MLKNIFILFFLLFSTLINAESIADLSRIATNQLQDSKQEYLRAGADSEVSWIDSFQDTLSEKLVLPKIAFDPDSHFDISFSANTRGIDESGIIPIENKINSTRPISELSSALTEENRVQNYLSYKCEAEEKEMSKFGLNSNVNLTSMVDDMVNQLENMEMDIKNSISNQISDTFSSISSYFTPEYAMEMVFRKFKTKMSETTCNFCKDKNLYGCDSVFFLAEILKNPAQEEMITQMADDQAKEREKEKEKGSYMDIVLGVNCATTSVLSGPSGVGSSVGKTKLKESKEKIKEAAKAAGQSFDDFAMETCLKKEGLKVTSWINTVIGTMISSIELKVRTQKKCVDENKDDSVLLNKNISLKELRNRSYFQSINKQIDRLNKIATSNTKSIIDKIRKPLNLLNYGMVSNVDEKASIKEILSEYNNDNGMISRQYLNTERALEKISKENSSSMAKYVATDMIKKLFGFTQIKGIYKEKAADTSETDAVFTSNVAEKKNNTAETLLELQAEYFRNLEFYENEMWTEMGKPMSNNSGIFICKSFTETDREELKKCFFKEEVSRLGGTPADMCNCTNFGITTEIMPSPSGKGDEIIKLLNANLLLNVDASSHIQTYKKYLIGLEIEYIKNVVSYLIRIKTDANEILAGMPIEEQEEVKRLFSISSEMFR